jgi:hypothetical protein
MDFIDVFKMAGVILIGIFVFFPLATDFNKEYGSNIGDSLSETRNKVEGMLYSNLSDMSVQTGNTVNPESGAGDTSKEEGLIRRSTEAIGKFGKLITIVPTAMGEAGDALGIPEQIVEIGKYMFIFAFAITFAYVLLLGAQSIRRLF